MSAVLGALPAVNAVLVTASGALIVYGVRSIRRGRREPHRRAMLAATALAAVFLILYLLRLSLGSTTVFAGTGLAKTVYLLVLFSHIGVAVVSSPLVVAALWLAWRGDFPRHRRIARLAWPLWLYVAVTGPLVYLMLHHWF